MDLIKACKSNDTEKALGLIMNNDTNSIVDVNNLALIWACRNKMIEVALELIKTGHAKPEQVDHYNNTALIWACQNKMKEVALELIKTGHAKPEQVNNWSYTALIWACQNKMKEVAL